MLTYRREIDGLRAIAVTAVILFHAGFHIFDGGFVGVDVFFVISGYLITSIIVSEKQDGTFTLAGFYERRARRILPALFVLMLACIPMALVSLPPSDFTDFSQSLVAATLFSSNILFYLKSGYFESANEPPPLLHTWSLAVEEQFYLLFPIFLLTMWRFRTPVLLGILMGMALISLAVTQWGSQVDASATFYLLPTRGWELLIGTLIALYTPMRVRHSISHPAAHEGLACAGVLLILFAVLAFDKDTPFPSVYALIPTIGSALVIVFATEQTRVGKVLGSQVVAGLGLLSYSAYLWHQPLFAFLKHRSMEEPSWILRMAIVGIVLLCAYLSWKWIETPFRNRQRISRRQVIVSGVCCGCLLVGIGLTGHFKNGFIEGITPHEMRVLYSPGKYARVLYREGVCFLTLAQAPTAFTDECHATGKDQRVFLWGDSHAAALSIGLRNAFHDITQYTASGCPPIKDIVIPWQHNCEHINTFILKELARTQPQVTFLHANWISYREQDVAGKLADTIQYIHSVVPSTHVIIVGGVPQWKRSLPKIMLIHGAVKGKETSIETPLWRELLDMDEHLLFASGKGGGTFVSALDKLCVNEQCQAVLTSPAGLRLTAWDNSHLTEEGSILLAQKILTSIPELRPE